MAVRNILLDAWSSISHKAPLREDAEARAKSWKVRDWVPDADRRRLNAYMVLAAYKANISRHFLRDNDSDPESENREYGDAQLIIDQVLAHLLGEDQQIVVPGAENYDPDMDDPRIEPEADDDAEPVEGEEPEPWEPDPDEVQAYLDNEEAGRLAEREEFLRDWAEKTHLELRVVDSERNAVTFGDGVYLLGWDTARRRATCAVMDPGFYFPVLPDSIDQYDYPTRVHFAWELPPEDFDDDTPRIRRITYEMRDLRESYPIDLESGEVRVVPPVRATFDASRGLVGKWVRSYPWDDPTADDYQPSDQACYMSDGMWKLDSVDKAIGYDDLDEDKAEWATNPETGQPVRGRPGRRRSR
jgi:hypothetical protein